MSTLDMLAPIGVGLLLLVLIGRRVWRAVASPAGTSWSDRFRR